MLKYFIVVIVVTAFLYGLFLFLNMEREVALAPSDSLSSVPEAAFDAEEAEDIEEPAEVARVVSSNPGRIQGIENQKPLPNPPEVIKAIYVTSWIAGTPSRMNELIKLIKETELNAVVIDIKDYSGYVAYDIQNEDVIKYRAKEIRIPRVNALIKQLHDEGIYVIARTTVFQDPLLVKARPDLALKNKVSGGVWYDNKGLGWVDPAAKEAWDYNIAIAKDAAERGFDEINFDYIRFASDGKLSEIGYPFFQETTTLKQSVLRDFFEYLRKELNGIVISADLFGLVTVNYDDLGIGQSLEDAYKYFDAVAPMVYASHYARTFLGFENPAAHPYEVVNYSMASANQRLKNLESASKLRPWLQHFDLGAIYDAAKIKAQIQATYDAGVTDGWMLWDPSNRYLYVREALRLE
ncbi:MAG: hypothetical protein UX23_C0010G0002 [Parcubacteria group bacterium GW2011_GWB1_45_9]|nr:MAG: hypothetical protein UX23_C0010G0002 [Parcubacteria group bacterium GW2011_GWB1_45_9]